MTYMESYVECVKNGCSPRLADMLASRRGPGVKTDTSFAAQFGNLEKQFADNQPHLRKIVAAAKAKGYNPNPNYIYSETLANSLGDPAAFIPPHEAANHMRKVAEAREVDLTVDGKLKYKAPRKGPPKPVRLAESLVKEGIQKMTAENPDFARKPKTVQREACLDRFAPL